MTPLRRRMTEDMRRRSDVMESSFALVGFAANTFPRAGNGASVSCH